MKKLSKQTKKELLYLGVGLIVVISIFVIVKKFKNRTIKSLSVPTPPAVNNTSSVKTTCDKTTVLKKGMKCSEVERAQNIINVYYKAIGIPSISVDGSFGSQTETGFYDILNTPSGTANQLYTGVENLLKKQ